MSDFSHLLTDPSTTAAIAAHVEARPGHKVVGLHDGVLVRDETIERKDKYDGMGWYAGTDIVRKPGPAYPTVEVVLVTAAGRPYAQRYKGTLDEFLTAAGVTVEAKAS